MSAFSVGAVFVGLAFLILGVALIIRSRGASERLQQRAQRAGAMPSFLFSATYLRLVAIFGATLGVGSIVVGLTR